MLVSQWDGSIFADYKQFYLWDSGRTQLAPTDYTDDDVVRRIKTGEHVVVISPDRNDTVPVVIQVHDVEPTFETSAWDHIAEASLHLPTGALQVHECMGGVVTDFEVVPGWYRVRSLHVGLASIDGFEGDDQYLITLWPASDAPVRVVKQFQRESSGR